MTTLSRTLSRTYELTAGQIVGGGLIVALLAAAQTAITAWIITG